MENLAWRNGWGIPTDCGGYELLRTQPQNSRELFVIPPQSDSEKYRWPSENIHSTHDLSALVEEKEKDEMEDKLCNEGWKSVHQMLLLHIIQWDDT